MKTKVIVLSGYGLNCEEETLHAFNHVGIDGNIIHINDLIENPKALDEYQILAIPGGFSYGDDTGSGNAFAQKMKLALWNELKAFVERDTLTIGICNGCQILVNLGLVPALNNYGERDVAVTYNASARYQCRWIDVKVESDSPWLKDIKTLHIPVAHGEGRFMMEEATLKTLESNGQIAAQYIKCHSDQAASAEKPRKDPSTQSKAELCSSLKETNNLCEVASARDDRFILANGEFPANPNGSISDIAAITDKTGRVLAIMPHPERGMFTWQRDDYHELKDQAQRDETELSEESEGIQIFKNAAKYFKD